MMEAVCNLGMCHLCAGGYPDDPCEHECHAEDGVFLEINNGKRFQAPHCNASMLHAPGECYYCDHYPKRQQAYIDGGIPFTPNESNGWSGNVAVKPGEYHEHMGAGYIVGRPRKTNTLFAWADGPITGQIIGDMKMGSDGYRVWDGKSWVPLTEFPKRDSLWSKLKRLFRR